MRRRISALATSSTLHLLALVLVAWSGSNAPRVTSPPPRAGSIAVFAVPPSDDSAPPGLNPLDTADEDVIRLSDGSATVALPAFTLDISKIGGRATLLFPFLTPGLSLERFAIESGRQMREAFRDPFAPARDGRSRERHADPPLTLSDAALQSLIDRSWSRRNRWTPFQEIVKLADTHSPDAGQLPALLQAYHRQNGLQPYVDASIRDPRLWTELGLAADHVEFIGFISGFAAEHRGTKATTELLFLLDQIAQANLDALVTLVDTDPAEALAWTREANPDAYTLIVDLRRHYAKQLKRKGLTSTDRIVSYYDNVRLGILTGILQNTPHGYRASDARFLIGAIEWRHGSVGDALRAWRGMTIDPTDAYAATIARIVNLIASETAGDRASVDSRDTMRLISGQIDSILRAEHGRWIMFSMDRLRQFGFHFDTF
jgi:hypothetical protein